MYKVIYLQGEEEFGDELTWCPDKYNDTDVKYILANSKTEAANDLYEALKGLYHNCEAPGKYLDMANEALRKAEGKS